MVKDFYGCSLNDKSISHRYHISFCEYKKQNTLTVHWSWIIFLFFKPFVEKESPKCFVA